MIMLLKVASSMVLIIITCIDEIASCLVVEVSALLSKVMSVSLKERHLKLRLIFLSLKPSYALVITT